MTFGPLQALRPFYGGVLVDQIMQACHWKTHNKYPTFYIKDFTWSDNDNNMFLGPVVAAQQVLDPSPQTSHPRKERKGGHIRYSQVFRSLSQDLGIGFLRFVDGPSGPLHSFSEHVCTSLLQSKHLDSFSTVVHSNQVFGSLQARSSGLGHCKRDLDWYF